MKRLSTGIFRVKGRCGPLIVCSVCLSPEPLTLRFQIVCEHRDIVAYASELPSLSYEFCEDRILGLFLKHSQWPRKAFALPGFRSNAASSLPWISVASCSMAAKTCLKSSLMLT